MPDKEGLIPTGLYFNHDRCRIAVSDWPENQIERPQDYYYYRPIPRYRVFACGMRFDYERSFVNERSGQEGEL
jgi:hypothetical protein